MESNFVVISFSIVGLCTALPQNDFESHLQRTLFEKYNTNVRPLMNNTDHVVVTVGIELRKIQEVDEIGQAMKTTVNLQLFWKDEYLTWNEADYNGLSSLVFPYNNNIWMPDLLIINALDKPGDLGLKGAFIRLYSNGQVFVWTQVNIKTYCEIKTKKYPFDEQTCSIAIGKFMSSDTILMVKPRINGLDLSHLVKIAEWGVQDTFVMARVITYNESIGDFIVITNYTRTTFTLKLKRTCRLCFLNIILPVLVLAVLDLLSYFVPCESGEKTSYPLSLFLTLAVFLTIISQFLPESVDGVSYLGAYVTFQLVISAITLTSAVLSLHLHYRKDSSVPGSIFARIISLCKRLATFRKKQHNEPEGISDEHQANITDDLNKENETKCHNESYIFDRFMFSCLSLCQIIAGIIFIACIYT